MDNDSWSRAGDAGVPPSQQVGGRRWRTVQKRSSGCGSRPINAQTNRPLPRILCEVLLLNSSPRLDDLSPALLDDLRRTAGTEKRSLLFQLQLATLGVMDPPRPPWSHALSSKASRRPGNPGRTAGRPPPRSRQPPGDTCIAACSKPVAGLPPSIPWSTNPGPGRASCARRTSPPSIACGSAITRNAATPSSTWSAGRSRPDRKKPTSAPCASSFATCRSGSGSLAGSIPRGPSPPPARSKHSRRSRSGT